MTGVRLEFLGGAGTVTGSKAIIKTDNHQVMVDCGMFQGLKNLRQRNWKKTKIDYEKLGHIILTHAHLDHSGYLPVLVRQGFQGSIHCTPTTKSLCELLLMDSAKIQEEDAQKANEGQYTKHNPAKPLYNSKDVERCLELFVTHDYGEWVVLNEDFKFSMHNAGHIAGSAWVELRAEGKKVVFSGDLGRQHPLLLLPPHRCEEADYLIIEGTYGGKNHPDESPEETLAAIINKTLENNGRVLIPAFAVERTQEILFMLGKMFLENRIPKQKIYLDSPMAISATEIFMNFPVKRVIEDEILEVLSKYLEGVKSAGESKKIIRENRPGIVIAGSGMLNGGRILNYLEEYIGDPNTSIILTGFQAEGTRGRQLIKGMPEIKFFGKFHRAKAKTYRINNLSAHADQKELILWIKRISKKPTRIFINHAEPNEADSFRVKLEDEFAIDCEVARLDHSYVL